jgi:hypothetical protein
MRKGCRLQVPDIPLAVVGMEEKSSLAPLAPSAVNHVAEPQLRFRPVWFNQRSAFL